MSKTIFYEWTEEVQEFDKFVYIGGGLSDPVFKTKTIKLQLRYSSEITPEMKKRAKAYLEEFKLDHPDAKIVIKEDN